MSSKEPDVSRPVTKKRKLEPEKYSVNSKIDVIDYLVKNFPQFKDINDMFQCREKINDKNYKKVMFQKLAMKDPSVTTKMFQFLQQFKKFIYQSDPTYIPEKHTSIEYIMKFLEYFGIESYLENDSVPNEKKLDVLDYINDCFNFLYQFVHNKSITEDSLFNDYRLQRLRYLEIVNSRNEKDLNNTVIVISPEASDAQQSSVDSIAALSNNNFNNKHAISSIDNNNESNDLSTNGIQTEVPKAQTSSTKAITAHFDFDLPDSPLDSPPLSPPVQLKELEFIEYTSIMNYLNHRIFTVSQSVQKLAHLKLLEHKLELMLGFFCCYKTSAILKIEISDLIPAIFSFNNGLYIKNNGSKASSLILRNSSPEFCPVLMICIRIFLLLVFSESQPSKLISLSYHEVIERRNETLKKVNIKNVSSLTTMMNVGKKFCIRKGISDKVMNNFEKQSVSNYENAAIATLFSGFSLDEQKDLKRAKVPTPSIITQKFRQAIPNYEEVCKNEQLKKLTDYTIMILAQDFPYIFKKYPSNPFRSFSPFNTPEFEAYLEHFNHNTYHNDNLPEVSSSGTVTPTKIDLAVQDIEALFELDRNVNTNLQRSSQNHINFANASRNAIVSNEGSDISSKATSLKNKPASLKSEITSNDLQQKSTHPQVHYNETLSDRALYSSRSCDQTEFDQLRKYVHDTFNEIGNSLRNHKEQLNTTIDKQIPLILESKFKSFARHTENNTISRINDLKSVMNKRDAVFVKELKSLNTMLSSLNKNVIFLQNANKRKLDDFSLNGLDEYRKIQKSNQNYWNDLENDLRELDSVNKYFGNDSQRHNIPSVSKNCSPNPSTAPTKLNKRESINLTDGSHQMQNILTDTNSKLLKTSHSQNCATNFPVLPSSTTSSLPHLAASTDTRLSHRPSDGSNLRSFFPVQSVSMTQLPIQSPSLFSNNTTVSSPDYSDAILNECKPKADQFTRFIRDWFYGSSDTHFHRIKDTQRSLISNIPGAVAQYYFNNHEILQYAAKALESAFSFKIPLDYLLNLILASVSQAALEVQNAPLSVLKTPSLLGYFILHGSECTPETTIKSRLDYISNLLIKTKNRIITNNINSSTTGKGAPSLKS